MCGFSSMGVRIQRTNEGKRDHKNESERKTHTEKEREKAKIDRFTVTRAHVLDGF